MVFNFEGKMKIDNILKEAKWIKTAEHSYACLMIPVPYKLKQHIQDVGNSIDKSKLDEEDGLEEFTHITVLYGLQNNDKDKIKIKGPIEIESNSKIEYFDNKDKGQSVAIVKVKSSKLHKIHKKLKSEIPNKHKFSPYVPHVTIAYLKYGERLENENISSVKWKADKFMFGDQNESQCYIKFEEE